MGAPSDPYPPEDPASTPHPATLPVSELSPISEMPDPLVMLDGSQVTSEAEWHVRRKEMIRLLEDYTYGHMPPPPGNTTSEALGPEEPGDGGAYTYQGLRLSFGPDQGLGFDLGLFLPTDAGDGPLPVLISLSFDSGPGSLGGAAAAIERGFAVATVPYQDLAKDSDSWATSPVFVVYPDYDFRDIAAWSWGMSRAVDALATNPRIDRGKIMVTGISRLGQAALHMGAFDQRVALSIPMAGGMALRHSGAEMGGGLGQGITEIVDQVTYWFGPLFPEFRNKTPLLPSDQHWLLALTAPRLFIMTNALSDQYGRAYAAAQTYLEAKPVFEFFGVPDHVGQFFRPGGHGATAEDWDAALDFADQYLLLREGDRRFDVLPPESDLP
jgi:hypothetical protein